MAGGRQGRIWTDGFWAVPLYAKNRCLEMKNRRNALKIPSVIVLNVFLLFSFLKQTLYQWVRTQPSHTVNDHECFVQYLYFTIPILSDIVNFIFVVYHVDAVVSFVEEKQIKELFNINDVAKME